MVGIKRYNLISIIAILIICVTVGYSFSQKTMSVEVIKPIVTTVEDAVTATGRVYESKTEKVYADGTGYIKEAYVKLGDEVKKGDKIALFEKTDSESTADETDTESVTSLPEGTDLEEYLQSYDTESENTAKTNNTKTEEIVLTAPADGVITALKTSGVSNESVATVSDFSELYITASINEALISDVKEGQTVRITGEGFKGLIYTGTVSNISPVAKQVISGSYTETVVETTISINNADIKLRPGFSVEVNILTNVSDSAVVVPFEAITADKDNKDCVYIIENGKAVMKTIETGLSNSYGIEIKNGIDNNAVVVINPPDNIQSAAKLVPN